MANDHGIVQINGEYLVFVGDGKLVVRLAGVAVVDELGVASGAVFGVGTQLHNPLYGQLSGKDAVHGAFPTVSVEQLLMDVVLHMVGIGYVPWLVVVGHDVEEAGVTGTSEGNVGHLGLVGNIRPFQYPIVFTDGLSLGGMEGGAETRAEVEGEVIKRQGGLGDGGWKSHRMSVVVFSIGTGGFVARLRWWRWLVGDDDHAVLPLYGDGFEVHVDVHYLATTIVHTIETSLGELFRVGDGGARRVVIASLATSGFGILVLFEGVSTHHFHSHRIGEILESVPMNGVLGVGAFDVGDGVDGVDKVEELLEVLGV